MPDVAPPIKLNTANGNKLRFRSLSASEELARLYEFNVVALADADVDVDLPGLLGTDAYVEIELPQGSPRRLHGIVAAAGLEGSVGKQLSYRLVLRPWLWNLTRRADTRIFQQMAVDVILRNVFSKYRHQVLFELQGSYPTYDYCVQYRETDFNFVSRLMEHEGIYYYFTHSDSGHKMIICDRMSSHVEAVGFEKVKYRDSHDAMLDFQAIEQWRSQFEVPPGMVALTDYDFVKPSTKLLVTAQSPRSQWHGYEYYDQPGEYTEKSEGSRYAQVRMEELDARYHRVSGASFSVRGLEVGRLFELIEHPRAAENDKYVLVSTRIEAQYSGYESGQGQTRFECRFSAIRSAEIFRPDRITPKPIVPGAQTAVVVGPSGEEIYTDEYGRAKVQFHWDREGERDENSSCWLRCASGWAGKAWGMISIPRIGQEVVVSFIEGDPDQPLITGRVYNAEQITPYLLPDNKTVSTIKSRSTLEGEPANFNEIAFEDKIGSEFIRVHAEKDFVQIVKNDAHLRVDNDQFRKVTNNVTEEIGGNTHLKVGGAATAYVVGKQDLKIDEDAIVKIGKSASNKLDLKVGGDTSHETGGNYSLKAASNGNVKMGANLNIEGGANVNIKAGANVVIEAGAQMTLKGAMINILADGIINIKGSLVNINTGGGGGGAQAASPTAPGTPADPEAPQPLVDRVQEIEDLLKKSR